MTNSISESSYPLGLIEGFYGQQWSWEDRHSIAAFLAEHGFQSYIYAPKGDAWLRSDWRSLAKGQHTDNLIKLREACHAAGLAWGLGFSPLAYTGSTADNSALESKLIEINALKPDTLWLLFDDMRGDDAHLASKQLKLIERICVQSNAKSFVFCPTYYSFDPILEEVFGAMPADYWAELGLGLKQDVAVLWTGDKVISPDYNARGLQKITQLLRRKPLLWDNYPVNDGRLTSDFLHLDAFDRPPELTQNSAGLFANPANQSYLSRFPLSTLAASLQLGQNGTPGGNRGVLRRQSFELFPELTDLLNRDWQNFQHTGRRTLEETGRIESLLGDYGSLHHPAAREVCKWLAGDYIFDPNCLTG